MQEIVSVENPPKENLLNQSAFLYVASYIAVFFRFLGGFITAGLLGPTMYGLRSVFGLVMEYEQFSDVGTMDGMTKEVPYYRGRSEQTTADGIVNNVFTANMAYAVGVGVLLMLAALYLIQANFEQIYIDFVLFLAVHIFLDKLILFYYTWLVVDKNSILLSKSRVVYQLSGAIFSVAFVYLYGLRGLFLGLFIADIITVLYLFYTVRKIPALQLSKTVLWSVIKVGLPITLIGLALLLLTSVDRIVIVAMLSEEMLGYFSIATILCGLVYLTLDDVIEVIFFPRLMEKLGASDDVAQIKVYLIEPTIITAYFVPLLIGGLFLSIHLPLIYLLPEYIPAINVSKTLILGAFFFCILSMSLLVCIALNKQIKVLFLSLAIVVLNALFSYFFITIGWGIDGVAIGTIAAYFIFSTAIIAYALQQFNSPLSENVGFFVKAYLPFVYAAVLLYFLDWLVIAPVDDLVSDVVVTAVKVIIFLVAYSLIMIPMRKQPAFVRLVDHLPVLNFRARRSMP
jgi:O-antigen/teichoic acid export membrane protein